MKLTEFLKGLNLRESYPDLTDAFTRLAPLFIYGGYIDAYGKYKVYIRTVEFYFHDETDAPGAIKDPIMYHRNDKGTGGDTPYFPPMSLNTHTSGIDITLENEAQKYRAAALIREYSIFDTGKGNFLLLKNGTRDDRSTFIYNYLNGFPIDGTSTIKWVDAPTDFRPALIQKPRKNVFVYENGEKTTTPDSRPWSFSMPEQ